MGITPRTTKIDVKYTLICYAPIHALPHYPPGAVDQGSDQLPH